MIIAIVGVLVPYSNSGVTLKLACFMERPQSKKSPSMTLNSDAWMSVSTYVHKDAYPYSLHHSSVLTSFDLARRHIDKLDTLPWSCVIVDEAHRLKSITSKLTQAFHQFACPRRIGLTGTAIQNSYDEMWTILDWTNPGCLGTRKQWKVLVAKPLAVGQSSGSSEEQRANALVSCRAHTPHSLAGD